MLIEGRLLRSPCVRCWSNLVLTVPEYCCLAPCGGCRPAPVHVRPPGGWPRGVPNPGRVVDAQARELDAVDLRRPRPVEAPRPPSGLDGLPRTFWDLAQVPGAVARVGSWEVWRTGDARADRVTGWWAQWWAGVLVPDGSRYVEQTWRCWDGPGEKWVRIPGVRYRVRHGMAT